MRRIARAALTAAFALAAVPASAGPSSAPFPFFFIPLFQAAPAPAMATAPATIDPRYGRQRQAAYHPQQPAHASTREIVAYAGHQAPGTIVITTGERRLYYVLGGGRAIRYAVGVGR
jgi:lipoprotein-anchoring transpeptidase ErfK/SrfK